MKAKEQIWLGDYLVKEDGMLRRITSEEFVSIGLLNSLDIAGANANIGDEVVVHTSDSVFEVEL